GGAVEQQRLHLDAGVARRLPRQRVDVDQSRGEGTERGMSARLGRDGGGHRRSPGASARARGRPASLHYRGGPLHPFARAGVPSSMSLTLVPAACAFASGFAMRMVDPLMLPIAQQFGLGATTVALLTSAYALPYALAQPFLGPLGDRFGKARCMQVCVLVLALALTVGVFAPSFHW